MKNTALIIIDVINACSSSRCETKKYGITFKKIRKMEPKLSKFIKQYESLNIGPIIYTNCTKWDKKHIAKNIIELYKDPKRRYYSANNSESPEKFYEIVPRKKDTIITKNTYDAFTNPKLEKILTTNKIKYIIIAGMKLQMLKLDRIYKNY